MLQLPPVEDILPIERRPAEQSEPEHQHDKDTNGGKAKVIEAEFRTFGIKSVIQPR